MMRTILCDRLRVDVPIIQAAMGNAASPALVAGVSNVGALGMLQFGWLEPAPIREQIRSTRTLTKRPFGAGFVLDRDQHDRLEVALDEGLSIISLFWGNPGPYVERVHRAGGVLMHAVGSVAEARHAA